MRFYEGGVYYNPEECQDYVGEDVPDECLETRAGRTAYTCLKVETPGGQVNCADLMPKHCGIFFNPPPETYHHSITAVGYGTVSEYKQLKDYLISVSVQDEDGADFWKIKNSWGEEWGEGGYMRIARGLGHCSLGTFFSLPQCS